MHITYLFHSFLAAFLLLQEFAFARYVAAVTFGGNVLAYLFYCFAGNDFCSYCSLYCDVELLAWQKVLQLFANAASESHGVVYVR